MDKLLNVVAAVENDNPFYDIIINNIKTDEEWDFYLIFETEVERDSSVSFNYDKVLEALSDFSDFELTGYVYGEDYAPETREECGSHVVEVLVER